MTLETLAVVVACTVRPPGQAATARECCERYLQITIGSSAPLRFHADRLLWERSGDDLGRDLTKCPCY